MSTMCARVRRSLVEAREPRPAELEHLRDCAGCCRYEKRLTTVRDALREHRSDAVPDAAFAARIVERLPASSPTDALGWAASRLLPASVAVVLVMTWLALSASGVRSTTPEVAPTEDLVSWVIDETLDPGESR